MKKLLLSIFLVLSLPVISQIKSMPLNDILKDTLKESATLNIITPYDSLENYVGMSRVEQYIGQTLYLPKMSHDEESGFNGFKKDLKGTVYCQIKSGITKCEAVAGKYFQVLSVERKTQAYTNDIYLLLKDNDTGNELYFDFTSGSFFPFIVEGHFKKMSSIFVGKDFYINKKSKYLIEALTKNKSLIFGDSLYLGEYLRVKCLDHLINESGVIYEDLFVFKSDKGQTLYFTLKEVLSNSSYLIKEKDMEMPRNAWEAKRSSLNKAIKKYKNKKAYNLYNISFDKLSGYTVDSIYYNKEYNWKDNVLIRMKDNKGVCLDLESDIFKDGTLFSLEDDFIFLPPKIKYPKVRYWNMIKEGTVKQGMTKLEARLSWGEPEKVNKTSGSWGVNEQWVYDSSYLYFENGILTSIQN